MKFLATFICLFLFIWEKSPAQDFQKTLNSEVSETMPGILFTIESGDEKLSWSGASGLNDLAVKDSLSPCQTFPDAKKPQSSK